MNEVSTSTKRMELLAPAGDWDALKAALAAGADAVYLGGKSFSARSQAANFDLPQLKEAAELLHLHRRKIYVTVNTLLADSELPGALEFLTELYNLGIDAVIVQDLGLIRLARKYLPSLELHASTQMTVHNREGANFLSSLGLRRIVLARELTEAEVASIAMSTGLDLEVFVHGALCVCYSGQCLMSSMIGGRSGNRGRCAQPCRLEYRFIEDGTVVPTQGAYLLSPRDLALAGLIPHLDHAGVRSLKIEGRMKRPEYVYSVVRVYRRLLDRFYEEPEDFRVFPQETEELEQAFNRGFSTGYFGGNRNGAIVNFTRPNNRGVYLGRVHSVNREAGRITLKLEASLETGDEVETWISQGGRQAGPVRTIELNGKKIGRAEAGETVSFPLEGKVGPGDRVFKVFSSRLSSETAQALSEDNPDVKIPLTADLWGGIGAPLKLTYRDNLGNQGLAVSQVPLQTARNRPLTAEVIAGQLGRLGNTPFRLNSLNTDIAPHSMAPLSELNQLRRQALDAILQNRLRPFARERIAWDAIIKNMNREAVCLATDRPSGRRDIRLSVWVPDVDSVRAVAAAADIIYVGGDELTGFHWDESTFREAVAIAHQDGSRLIIGLPRINRETQRNSWLKYLETALAIQADGICVSDLGAYEEVLRQSGPDIYLNYPFNFFNSQAVNALMHPRVKAATLSPELSLGQIKEIIARPELPALELLVQGPLELMISEYCPIGTVADNHRGCSAQCREKTFALRDRLNLDFPIRTDQFCRMHLLNSKDLCLLGNLPEIHRIGPLVWRFELKTSSAEVSREIAVRYRRALQMLNAGSKDLNLEAGVEELIQLTGRGITKGHLFRGVE